MNATICLCHYCDKHGPTVIFTTQTYKDIDTESLDDRVGKQKWKYGYIHNLESHQFKSETCQLCQSVPCHEVSFVSNDDKTKISYVSSRLPLLSTNYEGINEACKRALSIEVGAHKEDAFYFGDETRGNVIAYPFYMADHNARGRKGYFCLLVFMRDEIYLLNSFQFFAKFLGKIVNDLTAKAAKTYSHQKTVESASEKDGYYHVFHHYKLRTITDLVGKELWDQLHRQFCWILMAGGRRMIETVFHGTPLTTVVITEADYSFIMQIVDALAVSDLRRILHTMYTGNQLVIDCDSCPSADDLLRTFHLMMPEPLRQHTTIGHINEILKSFDISEKRHDRNNLLSPNIVTGVRANRTKFQSLEDLNYSIEVITTSMPVEDAQIVDEVLEIIQRKQFANFSRDLTLVLDDWRQKSRLWAVAGMTQTAETDGLEKPDDHSYYVDFIMASDLPAIATEEFSASRTLNVDRKLKAIGAEMQDLSLLSKWADIYGTIRIQT